MDAPPFVCSLALAFVTQVYSNTPETINLIIEVFVEVAHKQICYLGEVSGSEPRCSASWWTFSRFIQLHCSSLA